ncbi:MAG: LysM peptidoglycan-binding domain-containing protein [Oligoflexia bacterium]|nr:LysM peptidoglycan-binding domain-containing protein [Oligoflexia bacterium]
MHASIPSRSTFLLGLATLAACGRSVIDSTDPVALSAAPVVKASVLPTVDLDPEPMAPLPLPAELEAAPAPLEAALAAQESTDIVVRAGETLVVLADLAGCTAEDIAKLNGFDVTHMMLGGESILLPVDRVDIDTFQARRSERLDRRLDRYLRGRGGVAGVSTHRVHTGETGWSIARDVVSAPLWVVAAYNPDVDLDHLRIGDSLQVPVMADMVADLSEKGPAQP